MAGWYQADAITGLVDGAAVATWPDSSGNGLDATQATGASQPTYETNEQNGLPVVRFDGTNDYLTSGVSAAPNARTGFVVAKPTDLLAARALIEGTTQNGPFALRLEQTTGAVQLIKQNIALIGTSTTPAGVAGQADIFEYAYDRVSGAWDVFVSGVARSSGTSAQTLTASTLSIGRLGSDDFSEMMKGDIAAILLYDRILTSPERVAVRSWLGAKYGITVP